MNARATVADRGRRVQPIGSGPQSCPEISCPEISCPEMSCPETTRAPTQRQPSTLTTHGSRGSDRLEMNRWLSSLPPRVQGLVTLLIAVSVVAVGFFVARLLGNQFYPVILPAAGFITPMGLFQAVTGFSRDDMANRRVPQGLMLGVLFAMALGALVGLEANRAFFGVRW